MLDKVWKYLKRFAAGRDADASRSIEEANLLLHKLFVDGTIDEFIAVHGDESVHVIGSDAVCSIFLHTSDGRQFLMPGSPTRCDAEHAIASLYGSNEILDCGDWDAV